MRTSSAKAWMLIFSFESHSLRSMWTIPFSCCLYIACVLIHVQRGPTQMVDEPTPELLKAAALAALLDVAANVKAPAAARAAASRTMLEPIGAIGRLQDLGRLDESKRIAAEMSPEEIANEISRLSRKLPKPKMRKLKL